MVAKLTLQNNGNIAALITISAVFLPVLTNVAYICDKYVKYYEIYVILAAKSVFT